MYSKVNSCSVVGMNGIPTYVEADCGAGIPGFVMVGNLSSSIKESINRVKSAFKNSGIELPFTRVTINIFPADLKKDGAGYDLPIALSVLKALDIVGDEVDFSEYGFVGEIGLNGELVGINGILSIASAFRDKKFKGIILPKDNEQEALVIEGLDVIGLSNIQELVDLLSSKEEFENFKRPVPINLKLDEEKYDVDFSDVAGQAFLKRAAEVAVAGNHNIIFSGPAGTGKTMIARRIPTIMPPLTREENIEISKVYSIAGLLNKKSPLMSKRPFRAPHHSITIQSLLGGGVYPRPGEISLASSGVLFLDELPLFSKAAIETLREPLEDKSITLTRLKGLYEYPANFMLVSAMNPCPCGFYPDRNKCKCSPSQIRLYQRGVSKPILDRIDICAESSPVKFEEITGKTVGEPSAEIRKRIIAARKIQQERFKNCKKVKYNSAMNTSDIKKYCELGPNEEDFLKQVFNVKKLSARTYHKVLKVARTIADLAGSKDITIEHLSEAANYRGLEEKLFSESIL